MLDSASTARTAKHVAGLIYDWALSAGALATGPSAGSQAPDLFAFLGLPSDGRGPTASKRLRSLRLVAVTADDAERHVEVLVKNSIPEVAYRSFPDKVGDVTIEYVGHSDIPNFPPTAIPQTSDIGGSRFWTPGDRFACGSSITVAPVMTAGTMGALVRTEDGALCGLTNNHVTGQCNHTEVGMYVMCPANLDAEVGRPPPTAIGTHRILTQIQSGDPGQLKKQRLDAALFNIIDERLVTSWQGNRYFDTPTDTTAPRAHLKVKKVGRTTDLTTGRIVGEAMSKMIFPYKAVRFTADVHFEKLWAIRGSGDEFSTLGDSGSLVVTEDGAYAVGVTLGGIATTTYIMPIDDVLSHFKARLVGGHNL